MIKRALFAVVCCLSCVPAADDSSQVKDLRVLAMNFEPPELMASSCAPLFALLRGDGGTPDLSPLAVFASPVQTTWLILDPKGEGRPIRWSITACANQNDEKCENEGDFVHLAEGTTTAGELEVPLTPGLTFVDKPADGGLGTPLLVEVGAQDTFRGSGGFRMPIVIHVEAGEEEVYAQKLMVFSCKLFPEMNANVNPTLPGMALTTHETRALGPLDGGVWGENDLPQFVGRDAGIRFEPLPFSDREEAYTVPTFELKPLGLVESWKISWHSDVGRISPNETGGVGFDGEEGKHRVAWTPLLADTTEQDVSFWMVVRDGRGGQSWIQRKLHWKP